MNFELTSPEMGPLMQLEVLNVEAASSPLKALSRAWETYGVENDLRPFWGGRIQNLGEWVSDVVAGDYYQSKVPLHHDDFDITLPAGTYFIAEKAESKSFIAENFIDEALDDDLVGDFCQMAAPHPVTGERMSFPFWANQNGFSQIDRVTNQMVILAIAASGL